LGIVAISAHLDDAALSASASLAGRDATVLTIFAGLPPPELELASWDELTGATNSARRQSERLAEDAEAMRLLSTTGRYLDELDSQYRPSGEPPDLHRIAGAIAGYFTRDSTEAWIPAAIGGHPDHVLARDAALRAALIAGLPEIVLYADYPYVLSFGLPSWMTGRPAEVSLTPGQRETKTRIIGAYRSQSPALGLSEADLAADPAKLDVELFWRVAPESVIRPAPRASSLAVLAWPGQTDLYRNGALRQMPDCCHVLR
jgi:LmbE family N-acetylglucosaminyl deacetylase